MITAVYVGIHRFFIRRFLIRRFLRHNFLICRYDYNMSFKFFFFFFSQERFYLKNRQKHTATLIYTDNIIYNIYTTYIPPPPIIYTFSDVKIH